MIKKVVISAAGKGTRMGNLTDDKPKHLLEISGKPFLYYLLKRLEAAGFSEMILVVGYKKELFSDFIDKYNFKLTVVNQNEICEDDYGTAIPIKAVRDLIGQENFVSVAGDNLYSVRDMEKAQQDDKLNYIGGLKVTGGGRFGHLEVDGQGFLQNIIEKPENFPEGGRIINTSLYKFTPKIFEAVDKVRLSPRGEYEITDAIRILAKDKKVKLIELEDFWLDFGKPEDIEKLSEHLKDQP